MKKTSLLVIKELSYYPSGSGIEYFNNYFFLIGDDATHILKLNSVLDPVDTIVLYNNSEKRISKTTKADLESITIVKNQGTPALFLAGSGSAAPYRNSAWLINPANNEKTELRLDSFYQRLGRHGIEEINIEGAASTAEEIILINRGNKAYPKNFLVFTSNDFWSDQNNAPIRLVQVGGQTDTSFFNGVSGLAYSTKSDRLALTLTTENTYNSYADGAIGKSYIWVINNLSSKKMMPSITPDNLIDLEQIDKRFEGQKIESACIISEQEGVMDLLLVADNDNGKTVLFKLRLAL